MTGNTDTRKKANAVFFSVIMVLSMVAVGFAGFAGTAAAANAPNAENITLNGGDSIDIQEGGSEEVDIEFTATDLNPDDEEEEVVIDLGLDGNANFTGVSGVDTNVSTSSSPEVTDEGNITFGVTEDATNYDISVTVEDATIEADTPNSAALILTLEDEGGANDATDSVTKSSAVNIIDAAPDFQLDNLNPETIVGADGGTFDVSVDVTNTGQEDGTQDIVLSSEEISEEVAFQDVTEKDVNVDSGETETVTFEDVAIEEDASDGSDSYEFTISSDDDDVTGTLLVGETQDGSLAVEVRGDFDPDVDDPVPVALFDSETPANERTLDNAIAVEFTGSDGVADFSDLPVNGTSEDEGIEYVAVGAFGDEDFESDVDRATLFNDRTSTGLTVFIDRVVTADEINIDDVRPSDSVELDEDIEIDTEVLSEDLGTVGELDPFPDNEVTAELIDSTADEVDGVAEGDLTFDGTAVTDDDGIAEFAFELTGIDEDEIDEDVEFTLEFTPEDAEDDTVVATQTITFEAEPPSGQGTIVGSVDELTPDGDSNSEPAEGVNVHAVTEERADANTETVAADAETQFRVVTDVEDEADQEVLDVRADFLFTSDDASVTQNDSTLGVDVLDDAGDVDFTVLEDGEYVIQEFDEGDEEWTDVSSFEADNDLTYEATDERFEDVEADHTDVTSSDGGFNLNNLFTNGSTGDVDYIVIAGEGPVDPDGTNTGFADANAYDQVSVEQSATPGDEQLTVGLTVESFEVDIFFDFELDVTLIDEDGEQVKEDRIQNSEEIDVRVDVTPISQETDETVFSVADGQEVDLELIGDDDIGSLVDETVIIEADEDEAFGTTTFEAAEIGTGFVNVSASTENDEGDVFATEADDLVNDVSNQAEIEVFDVVEITGDVVNENDNNIPGAQIELFVVEDNSLADEPLDTTVSGTSGSYVFTDVETGTDYAIVATALDADGEEVSNTRELGDVDSSLGGEDIVIIGAVEDQPLQDAFFGVEDLTPEEATIEQGDDLTVSATIENTGAIEATQDVSLEVETEDGDVTELGTESLTLDSDDSDTVEFTVEDVQLDAGEYTHSVSSEDDSAEGTLTIEEADDGNENDSNPLNEYANEDGVIESDGLQDAFADWQASEIDSGTLQDAFAAWQSGNSVE